jgi:hypothetical protein
VRRAERAFGRMGGGNGVVHQLTCCGKSGDEETAFEGSLAPALVMMAAVVCSERRFTGARLGLRARCDLNRSISSLARRRPVLQRDGVG